MKISIIIPVYNAEKYLFNMLDSLLNQTFKDFEIIAVNDGSTDNSLKILNKYKQSFENFTIISQQNSGSYMARLKGINSACGDYITILDSDDSIEPNFLEELYLNVKKTNSDIVVCGFKRLDFESGKVFSKEMCNKKVDFINIDQSPDYLLEINTSLWNKLFKSSIIKNTVSLNTYTNILDDMIFLNLIYLNAHTISFVNKPLYNYIVHSSSLITSVRENDLLLIQNTLLELKKIYTKSTITQERIEVLSSMVFIHLIISMLYRIYNSNERKNYKKIKKQLNNFIKTNFNEYTTTKYLKLSYSISHHMRNIKTVIIKEIYSLNLYYLFLRCYNFMIKKLKIDIKW